MKISPTVLQISESATLSMPRRVAELRRRGLDIIDFGLGEPDFPSPAPAIAACHQALAEGATRYTEVAGLPALREALAEHYAVRFGAPWDASNAVVTVGAKAALFEVFAALAAHGPEVILPTPAWVTYPHQLNLLGARVVRVVTHHEDGFRVHADLIRPALSDRTAAVLVNSPCNPTGAVIGEEDLRGLARLCAERGIVLICDETYGRYVYDGMPPVSGASLARELGDHVVVIGSFSKIYSMTGWRVGYALGPRELIRAVTAIQSHVTSNPTSFAMRGALAALRDGEPFVEAIVAEFQRRRDLVVSRLRAIPDLPFTAPAGGFYVFPRFTAYYEAECPGSAAMAERLLDRAGVATMPGEVFGDDGHLRLAFIAPFENLLRGLERLVALFEKATRVCVQ